LRTFFGMAGDKNCNGKNSTVTYNEEYGCDCNISQGKKNVTNDNQNDTDSHQYVIYPAETKTIAIFFRSRFFTGFSFEIHNTTHCPYDGNQTNLNKYR